MDPASFPEAAWAASLADLEGVPVARLISQLRRQPPSQVFAALGRPYRDGVEAGVDARWQRCVQLGIEVTWIGDDRYPRILHGDPAPPAVLFSIGRLDLLEGRRSAVIGTRHATAAGRAAAFQLGHDLAATGIHVVSGLARGIDGCAHRGALSAGPDAAAPIGVVGSGLDVVYPGEHRELWAQVGRGGVLLSEYPPGTAPQAYHFPMRNRIVAALAEAVVVVESRHRGGSLITVDEAIRRGIPVLAVPGGIHNRAADGTNHLLREGASVAVDATDVLVALALEHRRVPAVGEPRQRPDAADLAVYEACAAQPCTVEGVVLHTSKTLVEVAMSLARLDQLGWVAEADGWYEAIGAPLR